MAPSLLSAATGALLLAATASAHFTVTNPTVMQPFNDDTEAQAPCGGYTPNLSAATTITDFHVGGDAVGTKSSHPQTNWLYRVTTDNAGAGNWTQIGQITTQSGAGAFCQSKITVPEAWVGKKAILSVVGNGPDGMLYQVCCSPPPSLSLSQSSMSFTITNASCHHKIVRRGELCRRHSLVRPLDMHNRQQRPVLWRHRLGFVRPRRQQRQRLIFPVAIRHAVIRNHIAHCHSQEWRFSCWRVCLWRLGRGGARSCGDGGVRGLIATLWARGFV